MDCAGRKWFARGAGCGVKRRRVRGARSAACKHGLQDVGASGFPFSNEKPEDAQLPAARSSPSYLRYAGRAPKIIGQKSKPSSPAFPSAGVFRAQTDGDTAAANEMGDVPPAAKGTSPSGLPHAHAGYVCARRSGAERNKAEHSAAHPFHETERGAWAWTG